MAETIRIGHVLTNLHDGGIEQMVLDLSRSLPRDRFEVRIYALIDNNPWILRFREAGIVVRTYAAHNRIAPASWLANARVVLSLAADLRDDDLDILQVHDFFPGVLGRVAGILARVPRTIATLHNTYTWLSKFHGLLNRALSLATDSIVGVSRACILDSIRRDHCSESMYLCIPNGIDSNRFFPRPESLPLLRQQLGWPQDAFVIGNIGTISERKRQSDLVMAFNSLTVNHPQLHLLVIGSRREHEASIHDEVLESVALSASPDKIALLSERNDIEHLLSGCDIFCMPSRVEGFGLALVEAMMSGLPVIGSRIPAFDEILDGGKEGLQHPVGDVGAIASAIKRLVDSQALRQEMGESGRKKAMQKYSLESSLQAWIRLYSSMQNG